MYNSEHYLSKIERNTTVLDKAPISVKQQCIAHIKWAVELSKRLDQLDYQEREIAINNIHKTMDEDYVAMGFELENVNNKKI